MGPGYDGLHVTSAANCISEYPVDVESGADGEGVILASKSKTGTCWYLVDLEMPPSATAFADAGGGYTYQFLGGTTLAGTAPQTQQANGAALTTAGLYYAKKTTATCSASTPVTETTASWKWGPTYSAAGSN